MFVVTITFRTCYESVNPLLDQYPQKNHRFARLISRLQAHSDDQNFWNTGEALLAAGDLSMLDLDMWLNRVRLDPGDVTARWYLAEVRGHLGEAETARSEWRKVLVLRPDAAPAAMRLAQAAFRGGDPEEAIRWLKRICNRRPDDARLTAAVLGLCLSEGFEREARALAEVLLSMRSEGGSEALFHVFRLFDDVPRACQAAGLHSSRPPRSPDHLWLAARAAAWSGDREASARYCAALAEVAPGGNAMAQKAIAELALGREDDSARTLASATQLFIDQPDHLGDLAAGLSQPRFERLRQVVMATLQRLAASDPEAAAALALAHYRLGDWQAAADIMQGTVRPKPLEELKIVARNIAVHRREIGELPVDAAGLAFSNGLESLLPTVPADQVETRRTGAVLVLGDDLAPAEREWLLHLLTRALPSVEVIEWGALRSDSDDGADAALISECHADCRRYVLGAAGAVSPDLQSGAAGGLGYLPPNLIAEVLWLQDQIRQSAPAAVYIAGGGIAVAASLAALRAGVTDVRCHVGQGWLKAGDQRHGFFRQAMRRILSDRRTLPIVPDEQSLVQVSELLEPAREPLLMAPSIDGKSMRDKARRIHKLRAAEALGTAEMPDGCVLISVYGLTGRSDAEAFRNAIGKLQSGRARFVIWRDHNDGHLSDALKAEGDCLVRPWPVSPGPFLIHCGLAIQWAGPGDGLQSLCHAAMSVPVLPVAGTNPPFPVPEIANAESLADRLVELLDAPEKLAAIAEEARLWVQANRPMRRSVRRIQRLEGIEVD